MPASLRVPRVVIVAATLAAAPRASAGVMNRLTRRRVKVLVRAAAETRGMSMPAAFFSLTTESPFSLDSKTRGVKIPTKNHFFGSYWFSDGRVRYSVPPRPPGPAS